MLSTLGEQLAIALLSKSDEHAPRHRQNLECSHAANESDLDGRECHRLGESERQGCADARNRIEFHTTARQIPPGLTPFSSLHAEGWAELLNSARANLIQKTR